MNLRSLRLRLLAGAALWIGLALLVAGIVIGALFVAVVEQDQRADLSATFARVVALIDRAASPPRLTAPLTDPRYDVPYGGLYWQIESATGERGRSRSLWDFVIPTGSDLQSEGPTFMSLPGPSGQSLSVLVRDITIGGGSGGQSLRVTVAENRDALDAAIARFGLAMAIALALLALVLIGAAWLQVHLGLRPLDRIRRGVEAIRRGETGRLGSDYPTEVLPLTHEVNELLAAQEASIAFARARAADLAHGLKTPLSVLSIMAQDLAGRSDATTAQQLQQLTADMHDKIDYQLRLSRLRMRTGGPALSTDLAKAVRRTLAVLKKTREGERLGWIEALGDQPAVDMEEQDLLELLGVLLENAAKWARSQVAISCSREDDKIVLEIADDGPGLTDDQISSLGQRGRPLDETGRGTGLGISIAHEIVALNNGSLAFGRVEGGGLRVRLALPVAESPP